MIENKMIENEELINALKACVIKLDNLDEANMWITISEVRKELLRILKESDEVMAHRRACLEIIEEVFNGMKESRYKGKREE